MLHHINFDIKTFSIISPFHKVIPQIFRKFVPQHKNLHYETIFLAYICLLLCVSGNLSARSLEKILNNA